VARWAKGAHVFKVFNQTGFNIMAAPVVDGRKTVMFIAGDDANAKPTVLKLVADVGFDAYDAGPLAAAGVLENLAMLWIRLAYLQGLGRDFAFALLKR
jgi:predicted dinucleotide-binding enzyme